MLLKNKLSKINFALNRNPKIERLKEYRSFIPEPYKACLTITADFELAWAWRYSKDSNRPLDTAILNATKERENIPVILSLCDRYEIPITWATVGHLFLEECKRENSTIHKEIPNVQKYRGLYWDFHGSDWFEYDPGTNYKEAPEWYAPDLIKMIVDSKVKHEIGCHTFSHIDCRDEVCPPDLFEAELNECKKEAARLGLKLKSFVHPGHTIGNLDKLVELGFTSFQSDPGNILGYPVKYKNGLWELKRTYEFVYRKEWSIDYHIYRYITIIKRAMKTKTVCVFWFHPSFDPVVVEKIFPEVFKFINENRDKIWVTTLSEYVEWLNTEAKQ